MPTYTYRCKKCSHEFDELQKITDKPLTTCPSCHSNSLMRVFTASAGVVFRGSGFYSTDYKKSGGGHSRKTDKTEAGPEAKHDLKPETKSEKRSEKRSGGV